MRPFFIVLVLIAIIYTGSNCVGSALSAQTPGPAAPVIEAITPKDDLTQSLILNVQLSATIANAACQNLNEMRQYQIIRDEAIKMIEKQYPGLTPDFNTNKLVPKK